MNAKEKVDQAIDYNISQLTNSSLSHMKVIALSGNQTQTVGADSPTDVVFELPIQAINLSESVLYADVSVPAQGAAKYAWIHQGISPFSSIQLSTRSGVYLCNIEANATDYVRVVCTSDATDQELENGAEIEPLYAGRWIPDTTWDGKSVGHDGETGNPTR